MILKLVKPSIFKIVHFNAISTLHKWDLIVPEMFEYNPDIICISGTWISDFVLCDLLTQ